MKKVQRIALGIIVFGLVMFLGVSLSQRDRRPGRQPPEDRVGPSIPSTRSDSRDETQYLVFVINWEGLFEASRSGMPSIINKNLTELIDRVGTVGTTRRKLGFTVLIPPWILEKGRPGKYPMVIKEIFNAARQNNIAAHLSIETHYFWDARPDLWNYFDPSKPGYDPNNKNNVEWSDWKGTPYPARYVDWGTPQKLAPHMCYNAPKIRSEIARLVTQFLAPPIKAELDALKSEGREYLFAGITVGSEPSLDNYEKIGAINIGLARFMDKQRAPKVQLGYNALHNLGYSQSRPPKDMSRALAEVNRDFIAYWGKHFVEAGIPMSRLYTHVAANSGYVGSPALEFTNAPIWIAFNDYTRPGWTTYPDGPLEKSFDLFYNELKKHGDPGWGGTEASPQGLGEARIPVDAYLKRHYDHGAKIIVMNIHATGQHLTQKLSQGVWGGDAVAAYRSFLGGTMSRAERRTEVAAPDSPSENPDQERIRKKVQKVASTLQEWHSKRVDPAKIQTLGDYMNEIAELLRAVKPQQAEAKADEALDYVNRQNLR